MTIMLAAAVSLPAMVRASEKLDYTVNVDYSTLEVDTVVHSSGEKFVRLDIAGLDNVAETNEPTLPVRMLTFEVPTYVNNFSVKLNSYTTVRTMTLSRAIAPMECLTTNEAIEGVSNPVVYGAGYSATPTAPTAEVVDEYFVDGLRHFVTVRVTPVLYTHATKSVKLCNRLSVSLAYDDCNAADMKFTPIKVAKGVQFAHRIDDSTLAATSSRRVNARAAFGTLEPQIKEYLILTPDSLKEGVTRLVAWKRQKGYNVKVQTFESIYSMPGYAVGSNANCFDEAASVREWMKKYYADNGAFYCLIIGDYRTSAPIRKFKSSFADLTDLNDKRYDPTDTYFADLSTTSGWTFSLDRSGIYSSYTGSAIFSFSIPVGRLLCNSINEIETFTDKLILYESYPGKGNSEYLTHGTLIKHYDAITYSDNKHIFNFIDNFIVTEHDDNNEAELRDLKPYVKDVMASLNRSGLYSFQVHGSPSYFRIATVRDTTGRWPQDRCISSKTEYRVTNSALRADENNGLDALTNFNSPSVLYSLSCEVAPFDNRNPKYPCNLAASFTVGGDYGGPLALMNTRDGYFGSSAEMESVFSQCISQNLKVGIAENISKRKAHSKSIICRHSIIGDPELAIWLHSPGKRSTAKASFSNGTLTINNFTSKANNIGFRCGNSSYIGTLYLADKQSIYIPDFVTVRPNSILSVYIQTPEYLPETILIPTSDKLTNVKEHYVLNNLKLCASAITSITDGLYPPINLNLGKNCDLSLFVYNSVTSDKGITVSDKSTLTIESEKNVVFKGDKISNGGTLNVTADTLTLKEGFEIAKGSTFDFHNR